MAKAKAKEKISELAQDELKGKLGDLQGELQQLRFQKVVGKVDNNQRIKVVRRDIARVKTIMNEYKLGIRGKEAKGTK